VAIDSGLITPIVTNSDKKGLKEIQSNVRDLATRAKAGKLLPEEFVGGSFTISNLGMFGIKEFKAVINPPQTCILAVGGSTPKLVEDTEEEADDAEDAEVSGDEEEGSDYGPVNLNEMSYLTVSLSHDQRAVDGEEAARWLSAFKGYMENPITLSL